MRLFHLGPTRTFSEDAARALLPTAAAWWGDAASDREPTLTAAASLEAVAAETAALPSNLGVLPYYNFLEGLVQESLDLVYEYELSIVALQRLPIRFCLGLPHAADGLSGVEAVHSHPKALAQCSTFLRANLPSARLEATSSTAEAAERVQRLGRDAAIAAEAALSAVGLTIARRDVGNRKQGRGNFTDFLLVARRSETPPPQQSTPTRTILAVTPNDDRVGLLADMLAVFRIFGLNIAKIHSRPAIDHVAVDLEPQMFYFELLTAPTAEAYHRALDALQFGTGRLGRPLVSLRTLGQFAEPADDAAELSETPERGASRD